MFSVSGLTVQYSGNILFENISFVINPRDRIGLVGKNGAGKTTILKIISGLQEPYKGSFLLPEGKTVGYLPQELTSYSKNTIYNETLTAFSEIVELEKDIKDINKEIESRNDFESQSYIKKIEVLNEKLDKFNYLGGNKREYNLEKVLKGLGFKEEDFQRNIEEFSGGWQMRVELAKLLLRKPDLLLLDEPTNHLDIESILWVEDFLKNYDGAVMMVSHDKMFLDNITQRTIEIVYGKIYDYKVSYTKFTEIREERLQSQIATAKNQQKFIEQQERFITRFRAKNTKSKQVQSKIKQLEKLDRVEFDELDTDEIKFSFPKAPRSGQTVLEVKNMKKAYGDNLVLNSLNFLLRRGERVAFVGKNGEGKTTMVKLITGEEKPVDGEIKLGVNVETGYYAQIQERSLADDLTVLQTIEDEAKGEWANISKIRGLLGAFLFNEEDIDKKVKVLSGGEKSRLALARLLLRSSNLLILDEPTNHLDISAKEVLKNALLSYDGTLILVSHDRDFLDGLTNKTFEFYDQKIHEHLGGINEFLSNHKVESFREFESNNKASSERQADVFVDSYQSDNKQKYLEGKDRERKLRKLKNSISKIEARIGKFEVRIGEIESEMQTEGYYSDPKRASEIGAEHKKVVSDLKEAMDKWEKLNTELENFTTEG